MAWTLEMHMLNAIEFRLRVLEWQKTEGAAKGRNQPKPMEPPKYVHEERAEEARAAKRAEAYLRRTGRR